MKRVPLLFLSFGASCCTLLCSCGTEQVARPTKSRSLPDYSYREPESIKAAQSLPWELWTTFQDQRGSRLTNRSLLLGDELLERGQRRSALDQYLKAVNEPLSPSEAEAAALRVSSQYLAFDQSTKALSTVSDFYKKRGASEAQVELPFALVLAYAYGRHNDIEQSLAWFSKANRLSAGGGAGAGVAQRGVVLLLRTLDQKTFENIALNWRNDPFINELIGRERSRRASRSYDPDDYKNNKPFWEGYDEEGIVPIAGIVSPHKMEPRVGVILSLSDRFGSLGRDTKQGLELALQAGETDLPLAVEVRDVGADSAGASAAVRELASGGGASVIVGPLLTEASVAAADTARELNIPLLSFSKSESFRTGSDIFRLGATTSSQIDALVNAAAGEYQASRFAVVYPRNANGMEYQQAFRRKLGSLGLELVTELSYAPGDDSSMAEAARELEGSTADAVLLADSIEMSGRFLSNLSSASRRRIRALGTALWDSPVKIANSQALFEGSVFVTPFFANSTRPVVQQFVESYRGKYQLSPNFLAAQGFDAGTIVASALRQSLRDGSPFKESVAHLPPYDGVTGAISFDSLGEIQRAFYVVEVTHDSFLEKLPGAAAPHTRETVTYRGNQRIDERTDTPVNDADGVAASGY